MLDKETQNSKNASKCSLGLFWAFPKALDSQFLHYTFIDISDIFSLFDFEDDIRKFSYFTTCRKVIFSFKPIINTTILKRNETKQGCESF